MGSIEATKAPFVLVCSTPVSGHFLPLCTIAADLVKRNYDVTFLTGAQFRPLVEKAGSKFLPLTGYCDIKESELATRWPERNKIPPGLAQVAFDLESVFVGSIPSQFEALQRALEGFKKEDPIRPVVIVGELVFLGTVPMLLGAGIRATGYIGIGIIPLILDSIDTAPMGPGLPPDASPEGRIRFAVMRKQIFGPGGPMFEVYESWKKTVASTGCSEPDTGMFNEPILKADRFLQMCLPEMEYPRSDLPDHVYYTGGLPMAKSQEWKEKPSWWSEITVNKEGKKIIATCQGTIALTYTDIIIPTLEAYHDSPETTVVVSLGKIGANLPEDFVIPSNARVLDYIPFDHLLRVADVFVTNGGYGGFQQSIAYGTPLVVGGATEDKPEVSMRAEWCGAGINLRTGTPTVEEVKVATDEVLKNKKYLERVKELQTKMSKYNPFQCIADSVDELARGEVVSKKYVGGVAGYSQHQE